MKFFDNLPTITYEPTNIEETALIKNLFFILDLVINDDNFVGLYNIEGIKRIDNISFELYGSTDYWWIIAKLNDITDIIFDLPIDENILQKIAEDRTLASVDSGGGGFTTLEDSGALTYYVTQFDLLVTENDAKRQINIIKPEYLDIVISEIVKNL